MSKTWKKSIQNPPLTPWLDWIVSEVKKFEGRIYRDELAEMKVGDVIIFKCEDKKVPVIITSINKYSNFGNAFSIHGMELHPTANTVKDAEIAYSDIFKEEKDKDDILEKGVVAIGLKPIN